jgi:hypothetical protein
MLNRHKIFQQLQESVPSYFQHTDNALAAAQNMWQELCRNQDLCAAVMRSKVTVPLPEPIDPLHTAFLVERQAHPYKIISTDGSQIYPDRHQGINCYVLNIGIAEFSYGLETSGANLFSEPLVHMHSDESHNATEIIDCQRTELEFKRGFESIEKKVREVSQPTLYLSDGSLICWDLEHIDIDIKQEYSTRLFTLFDQFYQNKILIAGYISLPGSKELMQLVRAGVTHTRVETDNQELDFTLITDGLLLNTLLPLNYRTGIFASKSSITTLYPPHLKPHFFYMHVPEEIVRIEIPAWIAQDKAAITSIAQIVLDQAYKGSGYPVVLAEAHEQAVVTHHDREIFFQLIQKITAGQHKPLRISQKSYKKRIVGV